jgi:hypothetical protein
MKFYIDTITYCHRDSELHFLTGSKLTDPERRALITALQEAFSKCPLSHDPPDLAVQAVCKALPNRAALSKLHSIHFVFKNTP